jgi:hypothetical protein
MKRLMLSVLSVAVAAATTLAAQSKDLGGTWTLDSAKSEGKGPGPAMLVITLTDTEFTARMGGATSPAMTFRLDGTETALKNGGKTKAAWKGQKLEATVISPNGVPEAVLFSRNGEWLVMEGVMPHDGPVKFYFKRAPAKQ